MSDEATCGQGLTANAPLPARLGDLAAAMAAVLDNHLLSLAMDPESKPERETYAELTHELRSIATMLSTVAARMERSRDLPMATHDEAMLASAASVDSLRSFVKAKRDLLDHLRVSVERDETILREMR
jgi:hypothetical protein